MIVKGTLFILVLVVLCQLVHGYPTAAWSKLNRATPDDELRIIFAVKHKSDSAIQSLFDSISLPDGDHYRQFLTLEELANKVGPTKTTQREIHTYLRSIHARNIKWTIGGEFVEFNINVNDAEDAWTTKFYQFENKISHRIITRATKIISLPPMIDNVIELSLGTHDFFDTKAERRGIVRAPSDSASYNAPYILMVMGSESDVFVYFYAVCSNGLYTDNPQFPCSEYGSAIQNFYVSMIPEGSNRVINIVATPTTAKCALVSNQTVCRVQAEVDQYTRLNITTQTLYTNNVNSTAYNYPTLYSPTPYITPQVVYETYNIPTGTRGVNIKNSQAIVSFEQQYYSHTDLKNFFDYVGLKQEMPTLIGYNNDSMPGGEATLDVQWVMGIGQGVPTTTWSFPVGDYILNWAMAVANVSNAPLVTSISYGDTETGYEQKSGYGLQYIYRMNTELMKMAARGLTVMAGSGDAGWSNVGEMGNDLSAPDPTCTPGRAFYPSVSPYVMSLSSTFLTTNSLGVCGQYITPVPGDADIAVQITCRNRVGETAVSVSSGISWTTGGGFSNVTSRHAYQNQAVEYFLNTSTSLPPTAYWNSSGQGYADIATIGWNQLVVWGGVFFPIGGTSASGPVAAGVFALLNDALLNAGKSPLGFINPKLYEWAHSHPDAFNDVTVGKNNDGDIQPPNSQYPIFCPYGFTAQPGWDPVTGLGTPNFAKLKQLVLERL